MAEDVRISCEYAPDIAKRDFLVSALTQIREAKKAASIEPSAELATVFIRELATLLRWGMSLQCHKAKEWIFELLESWEIARPLARTAASDPSDAKRFRACEIICKIVTAKQPIDEQPEDFTDSPSAAMKIETPARTIPCFQGMGDIVAARSGRFNVRAAIAETAFPMGRAVATRELDHEGRGFSGTILIDGSGSMGWAVDAIENLAASAPASLIAVYNGSGGRGELIIVAKNGMRSPTVEITYGGNDVDYPAIIWLLGQAGPRVLISDLNFYGGKKAEREAARYLVGSLDKVLTSADAAERWVKSIAN
jgi:hypothetical protein